jgi:biotin transporter BioY
MVVGYAAFFGTLTVLFWRDNRNRYGQMDRKSVRQELAKVVSSIGIGEIIYFTVGWFTLYYLLDVGLEPYAAALISRAVAASIYLPVVSVVLKAAKTY